MCQSYSKSVIPQIYFWLSFFFFFFHFPPCTIVDEVGLSAACLWSIPALFTIKGRRRRKRGIDLVRTTDINIEANLQWCTSAPHIYLFMADQSRPICISVHPHPILVKSITGNVKGLSEWKNNLRMSRNT